jgi:hypothetical protein
MNFGYPLLFDANLFHPIGSITVQLFLDGEVSHSRGCSGTMPCFSPGGIHSTSPG